MFEEVIRVLTAGMAKSDAAANRPRTDVHPAYQYGVNVGRHQGWQEAIDAVGGMLKAEEDRERE